MSLEMNYSLFTSECLPSLFSAKPYVLILLNHIMNFYLLFFVFRLKRLLENYSANVSISGNTVINLQSSNIILMVQEISTTEKLGSTLNLHPIFEDDKDKVRSDVYFRGKNL